MFFWILSSLWTAGFCALIYLMDQSTGNWNLSDVSQFNQLKWIVPIWALGEVYVFHLFKKRKSEQIVQQAMSDHPFVPVKGFVPNAMPSQGKSMLYIPKPAVSNPVAQTQPTVSAAQPVPSNPGLALEKQAVEMITKMAEEKGLTPFPHVLLQNIMIPLTVSEDVKALLMVFLSQSGTWKVEAKEDISDTIWTNQTTSLPLLKKPLEAKRILSEMEPDAEVIPVLVVLDGDIEQEQQVQEMLNKSAIRLVRLNAKENSTLLTVSQLLDQEFEFLKNQTESGEENA